MTVSGVIQTPFKRPFFEIGEMVILKSWPCSKGHKMQDAVSYQQ